MKKKSLFITCSVIMMMCFAIPCLAMGEDENSFTKYNCETGEIEEYKIEVSNAVQEDFATSFPETTSVIGVNEWFLIDDPIKWDQPYECVGQVTAKWESGESKKGTATMISNATALTAGNIIYDKSYGGYADKVLLSVARSSNQNYYGELSGVELHIPTRYYNYEDEPYDLGLITISLPLGLDSGYMNYATLDNDSLISDTPILVLGYPREGVTKPNYEAPLPTGKDMFGSWGFIQSITNGVIQHDADTYKGMAGAPIIANDSSSKATIAGVHTTGKGTYNQGVKLKPTFKEWIDEKKK